MMKPEQAITWFEQIQSGIGTYPERTAFLEKFGAGSSAKAIWNEGEFTLGIEYGILIALAKAYDLPGRDDAKAKG